MDDEDVWGLVEEETNDKLLHGFGADTSSYGPIIELVRGMGIERLRELEQLISSNAGPNDDGYRSWQILKGVLYELSEVNLDDWEFVAVGLLADGVSCRYGGHQFEVKRRGEKFFLGDQRYEPDVKVLIRREIAAQ
jgi:hypothetical protein